MLGNPTFPLLWKSDGAGPDEQALGAWCAYTGQDEYAAQNWGWLNALHPDDRSWARETWEEAYRAPTTFALVYRVQQDGLDYQSFRVQGIPRFNEEHHLLAWIVFFVPESGYNPLLDEHWELRLMNRMIYGQMVLGILCLSLDGRITRVNGRLSQLTGYTDEELLEMTLWQLVYIEDVPLQLRAMHGRLVSGRSYPPFQIRYRRKDGSAIWLRITEFLVRLPSGEPYYFFYVAEDVGKQVRAEIERSELLARVRQAHDESLARTHQLEAIFDSITDGILVCDTEGNIIQSNMAVQQIFRLDLFPGLLHMPLAQRLALLEAYDEQGQRFTQEMWPLVRLLRGEDVRGSRAVEMHLVFPDGQEAYLSYTGATLRDQDEHIVGAVVAIRDVTERRQWEGRIYNAFETLLAFAEELVDIPGFFGGATGGESAEQVPTPRVAQTAGEYLAALTCQLLGYETASISLLVPETGMFRLVAMTGFPPEEEALAREKNRTFPLSRYLDEQTIVLLHVNEAVIQDITLNLVVTRRQRSLIAPMTLEGRLVGFLSVTKRGEHPSYTEEEISLVKAVAKLVLLVMERERMQQEWIEARTNELALREANRRFDEFLSIASHELRTPLAGIKGNIQLALRRLAFMKEPEPALPEQDVLLDKLEKVLDYLRHAEHRVNVQNRMIGDLLDVSRIQANRLELMMRPCNLAAVVRDAIEDQRYTTSERVITLTPPDCHRIPVFGDADRLGQVVHNYLTNALKYSPEDKPIVVSMETLDDIDIVRVSVRDEGPGLSREDQKHVWERFYRVKNIQTQGDAAPGLGLGLHICRTIIEAHGGKFGLESAPGEGSTFWFTLPLVKDTRPAPEQQAPAFQQSTPG